METGSITPQEIAVLTDEQLYIQNKSIEVYYKDTPPQQKTFMFMEHFHQGYEIIYLVNGKARYVLEGREFHLHKHDVIFTRPKTYHYIETYPDCAYERINILLAPIEKYERLCNDISQDFFVFNCANHPIILQIFSKMHHYHSAFDGQIATKLIEHLCQELLCNFSLFKQEELLAPNSTSSLIQSAIAYIKTHLETIQNLDDVAQALFVSKSYLFKSFKKAMKISPKRYILMLRLHLAHTLLVAGEKSTVIAEKCGFNNYNTFYKSFVQHYGYPPSKA